MGYKEGRRRRRKAKKKEGEEEERRRKAKKGEEEGGGGNAQAHLQHLNAECENTNCNDELYCEAGEALKSTHLPGE